MNLSSRFVSKGYNIISAKEYWKQTGSSAALYQLFEEDLYYKWGDVTKRESDPTMLLLHTRAWDKSEGDFID